MKLTPKELRTGTEELLRDGDAPWPKSEKELMQVIKALSEREHDYGTAVYAVSLVATAAFNFMASRMGITGFQASCADLDILRRTRHLENGLRVVNYDHLLYPQYLNEEYFPNAESLLCENADRLSAAAKEKMRENKKEDVHPEVWARWEYVAALRNGA